MPSGRERCWGRLFEIWSRSGIDGVVKDPWLEKDLAEAGLSIIRSFGRL